MQFSGFIRRIIQNQNNFYHEDHEGHEDKTMGKDMMLSS
jgi:hypothetical protein